MVQFNVEHTTELADDWQKDFERVLQRAQGVVQKWNADILQRRLCRSSVACGEGVHRGGRCPDQTRK